MRGYDPIEVETFLEKIAEDVDHLLQENLQLNKQLTSVETELKHYKEVEKTLKQTLYSVQQSTQLSRDNSMKEANLIRKEAELTAAQIIDEARVEARHLEEEVQTLKQQKESLATRLRHLLSSQLELLEILQMDDAERIPGRERGKKSLPGRTQHETPFQSEAPVPEAKLVLPESVNETIPEIEELPASQDEIVLPDAVRKEKKKGEELLKDILGEHLDEY